MLLLFHSVIVQAMCVCVKRITLNPKILKKKNSLNDLLLRSLKQTLIIALRAAVGGYKQHQLFR